MSSNVKSFLFAGVMCLIMSILLTSANLGLRDRQALNIEIDTQKTILSVLGLIESNKKYTGDEINRVFSESVEKAYTDQSGQLYDSSTIKIGPSYFENGSTIDAATSQAIVNDLSQSGLISKDGYLEQDEIKSSETIFNALSSTNESVKSIVASSLEIARRNIIYILKKNDSIVRYAVPVSGYGLWSTIYGFLALEKDGETIAGFTVYAHGETPGLGGECEKEWFKEQFVGKKITDKEGNFISVGIAKGKVKGAIPETKWDNWVDGMSGATITSKGIQAFLKTDLEKYEGFSQILRTEAQS